MIGEILLYIPIMVLFAWGYFAFPLGIVIDFFFFFGIICMILGGIGWWRGDSLGKKVLGYGAAEFITSIALIALAMYLVSL